MSPRSGTPPTAYHCRAATALARAWRLRRGGVRRCCWASANPPTSPSVMQRRGRGPARSRATTPARQRPWPGAHRTTHTGSPTHRQGTPVSDLQVVATIPASPRRPTRSARPCRRSPRRPARRRGAWPTTCSSRAARRAPSSRSSGGPTPRPSTPTWDAARGGRVRGRRRVRSAARSRSTRCSRWAERTGLRQAQRPARRAAAQQHGGRHDEQQRQRAEPRHEHERRHHQRQAQRTSHEVARDAAAGEHRVGLAHARSSSPRAGRMSQRRRSASSQAAPALTAVTPSTEGQVPTFLASGCETPIAVQ